MMRNSRAGSLTLLVLVAAAGGCSPSRDVSPERGRRYIQTTDIRAASGGPPIIVTSEGRRIYVGAQAALDSEGNIGGLEDVAVQTRRALQNLNIRHP